MRVCMYLYVYECVCMMHVCYACVYRYASLNDGDTFWEMPR